MRRGSSRRAFSGTNGLTPLEAQNHGMRSARQPLQRRRETLPALVERSYSMCTALRVMHRMARGPSLSPRCCHRPMR